MGLRQILKGLTGASASPRRMGKTTNGTANSTHGSRNGKVDSAAQRASVAPLPLIGHLPVKAQYKAVSWAMVGLFALSGVLSFYATVNSNEVSYNKTTATDLDQNLQQYSFALRKVVQGQDTFLPVAFLSQGRVQDALDALRFTTFDDMPAAKGVARVNIDAVNKTWSDANAVRGDLQSAHIAALALRGKMSSIQKPLKDLADEVKVAAVAAGIPGDLLEKSSIQFDAVLRLAIASEVNVSFANYGKTLGVASGRLLSSLADLGAQAKTKEEAQKFENLTKKVKSITDGAQKIATGVNQEAFIKASTELLGSVERMSLSLSQAEAEMDSQAFATNYIYGLAVLMILAGLGMLLALFRVSAYESAQYFESTQKENEKLQLSIMMLLDDIAPVADGDLTHKAKSLEGFAGAIADSMNFTIEELRRVITNVVETAKRVDMTADEAAQTSTSMAIAAGEQFEKITATGDQIVSISSRMEDIAKETEATALSARNSKIVSDQGITIVDETITRMNSIRDNIQETSKKIKLLGESSTAIGEVTGLIRDITKQINILALNAAIQAASAGEAGRGFAVVAQEVQRLALSSGDAAKKIDDMVLTIQEDAKVAVSSMEESTREVVEGAKLTDRAGAALKEIGASVDQVTQSIEEITKRIENESKEAIGVSREMGDLQDATQKAMDDTEKTTDAVFEVKALSEELKTSVANFRV